MRSLKWLAGVLLSLASVASAGEISFVEDFSLAPDRSVALKQLVPGTEDFYYYHCLHYQQTQQFDKVEPLLTQWVERIGHTARENEILLRQALLTYDKNPQKTLEFLRNKLGVQFNHQQEEHGVEPNLPTVFDAQAIARQTLTQRAFQHGGTDGFEDAALDWLVDVPLDADRRRHLLSRMTRPDYTGLVKLVIDDINHPNTGGFGSFNIHRLLTKAQLGECLKLRPDLNHNHHWVVPSLIKLQPGPDEDWQHDAKSMTAYLDRIMAFANTLPPVQNPLKAQTLYHRLWLDRSRGVFDKDRFLAYLKLPRPVGYLSKVMRESDDLKRFAADLTIDLRPGILLPPVGDDEPLVRSYLQQFLVDAANTNEFEPFINDVYLQHLFAETKIVNGLGEPEQWAALLPAALFQQLKQRVDIDFDPTNKTTFTADEPVSLDVHVKNASTLIVKVFAINTRNFYGEQRREVDTDINLDGLVANQESTREYPEPPLRRVRRRFDFPQLKKPGVYVIDFIGNGRSSRALIRKGQLKFLVRTGTAGQVFTILDEQNRKVDDARLKLAGHEYSPNKDGTITVPFTHQPGRQPIVLISRSQALRGNASTDAPRREPAKDAKRQDVRSQAERGNEENGHVDNLPHEYACLNYFQHEAESYSLAAGMFVDRESLLTRKKAQLVVRPQLSLNGTPVSVKILEDVRLRIISTDHDGVASSTEVPNFKLFEDRESVHEFQVPQRVQSLQFALLAKIQNLSLNQKIDLAAGESLSLNEIERTDRIEDLHLVRTDKGYIIELLGKTGEPKTSRPVQVVLKHRDFRDPIHATLKTDKRGRVMLGQLPDILNLIVTGPEGTSHSWPLRADSHVYTQSLHGRVGEALTLPYLPNNSWRAGGVSPPVDANVKSGTDSQRTGGLTPPARQSALLRGELSLLELRADSFTIDRFENLSIKNGLVTISGLPAGDFDLWLKSTNSHVRIRIAPGEQQHGYVLGQVRQLETRALPALQIDSVKTDNKELTIQLSNLSPFARVHIFATRFNPAFAAADHLSKIIVAEPYAITSAPIESVYIAGRNIGDEYRYIIDRKYAKKFPGNSLERPSLLLNPWVVRTTETGEQIAAGGDEFAAKGAAPGRTGGRGEAKAAGVAAHKDFANLDFLADTSAVFLNLVPDKNGRVTLKRDALGAHQHLHIVACDPLSTTYRSVALPEPEAKFIDLRLANNLDPKTHFTQQKQISLVRAGEPFTLDDITSSKFEAYDSLARVYLLFTTLTHDPKLADFQFVMNWPTLKPEEKRAMYSKYASHELSFFLAKKDPEFFRTVIKPYLANKKDKTFLDQWLLEADVSGHLKPWSHNQLNVAERILLGQRIAGEAPKTARHIAELQLLQPPNIDHFLHLFDTAVKGSALETGDALGLKDAMSREVSLQLKDFNAPAAGVVATNGLPQSLAENLSAPAGKPAEMAEDRKKARATRRLMGEKAKQDSISEKLAAGAARDGKLRDRLRTEVWDADDLVLGAKETEMLFFDAEQARGAVRQLYRKLDPTKEWAENNYYNLLIADQHAGLVTVNAFWRDYAAHDFAGEKPFLSTNLSEASRNFSEMMLALAVLDLPFEAAKHETKFDGTKMTLAPGSSMIVFHEAVKPAKPAAAAVPILVSQNFFKRGDRHRQENGEQIDKYVTEEFLIHTVYGCQVVVTNPTSARQKLTLLLQVPQGAMPVANGQPTKSVHVDLQPYHTQTLDYYFYFPVAGQYPHFPVHVAKNGELIAFSQSTTLNVVDKPTKFDTESWDYVSQHASADDVLTFLNKHNVHSLNLEKAAWRMRDAKFFDAAISLLAARHAYHQTLWSYGIAHNHVAAIREFLQHNDGLVNEAGGRLSSPLLDINPVVRRTYEHLDYKPLVNARSHRLGQQRQIVNARFHEQYHRTLQQLSYQRSLNDDDLMVVTYDLLLQDRIEEALATCARVNPDRLATRLQYDYFTAYLDFFSDDPKQARAIAKKYADHPVDRWRQAFAAITAQLEEIDGAGPKKIDTEDRNQEQTQLAATDPNFDFTVEAKQLTINHQNLDEVRVSYYLMDVELLFSRNPFAQQFSGQFSLIRPNRVDTVALVDRKLGAADGTRRGSPDGTRRGSPDPAADPDRRSPAANGGGDSNSTENEGDLRSSEAAGSGDPRPAQPTAGSKKVELPKELHNKNVLVEITGGGQTKAQAYYSNFLAVQFIENYGQLKVTHATTTKPVAKAYVKVYAQRPDGSSRFYKDGYTDLRGRFDYSSLNTNDLDAVTKFSVLVMSDEHGAIVKEANPPKQ